jgi:hypothetical protein
MYSTGWLGIHHVDVAIMNETLSDMNFLEKEIETSVSEVLTTLLDAWNSIGAATHKTICKHGRRWTHHKRKTKNHIKHD